MPTDSNKSSRQLLRSNITGAKRLWPNQVTEALLRYLRKLTTEYLISVCDGDVQLLDSRWYVTHLGLLRIAKLRSCAGIEVRSVPQYCDPLASRWAFRATVFSSPTCKGFVGYGDADPNNVSYVVRGAEMRIAETRAVNRALRKAYGIGICSVEELGSSPLPPEPLAAVQKPARFGVVNANGNGTNHPLRDRLLVAIRQHQLDPALVKLYAADFCEVKELREASREQIEEFVEQLVQNAVNDRDGLICHLNSYAAPKEGVA